MIRPTVAALVLAVLCAPMLPACTLAPGSPEAPAASPHACPMHPAVRADGPGRCPLCGMDLVPVASTDDGSVGISDARRARWGIRTVAAEQRRVTRTVRLAGVVGWDLSRQRDVVVRATGVVAGLRVAQGAAVARGEVLFELQSPEIRAAQQDFLAVDPAGAASARARLVSLGLAEAQIDAVTAARAPLGGVPVLAPVAGIVAELGVVEGSPVGPWTAPARIAGAGAVWVDVTASAADAAALPPGARATVNLRSRSGEAWHGVVRALPSPDAATSRLRVVVEDDGGPPLLPGEVATVTVEVDRGELLVVPRDAVVWTGARRVVFVDVGEGALRPREVLAEAPIGEVVPIRGGLAAGERVVRDGAFLVAAESRVRDPDAWDRGVTP